MLLLATSYRVAFDITRDARPDDVAQGRLVVLLILVTGVLLFIFRRQLPPVLRVVFPALFITFGCLRVVALIFRNVPQPSELAAAYRAGQCEVVEGVVTQFHPMPGQRTRFRVLCCRTKAFPLFGLQHDCRISSECPAWRPDPRRPASAHSLSWE